SNRQHPRSNIFPYTTLFRSRLRNQKRPLNPKDQRWQTSTKSFSQAISLATPNCAIPRKELPLPGSGWQSIEPGRTRPAPLRKKRSEEHTSELQSRRDLVCRL